MEEMEAIEAEHLMTLKLEDGSEIEFKRTADKEIHVCRDGHCVILPKASGQVTLDLAALLEPFGKVEEEQEQDGAV